METNAHRTEIFFRIGIDALLFVSIFIAPSWVTIGIAVLSTFFFHRFYEIVIAGLIIDAVYLPTFGGIVPAPATFSAIVLYALLAFWKPRLRAYVS